MGSTCAGRTLKYVEWNRCVDTALRDQLTHLAALGKTTKDTRAMTDEPDWMNPANDRKTPYTEEELERFVSDFIIGLDDQEWANLKTTYGEVNIREKIKAGFIAQDPRNLINLKPEDGIH